MKWQLVISLWLALILGVRHGIDWDHIAAITDLVGVEKTSKRGMALATTYSLGHGTVILLLGSMAIFLGSSLPEWVDFWMEKLVGVTLIILGLWLIKAIYRKQHHHLNMSRWKLILTGIIRFYEWTISKIKGSQVEKREISGEMGFVGAFIVGIIHGFGAETPTQIILFTTAAGLGTFSSGLMVVVSFVVGMVISTSLIALLSTLGYMKARNNNKLFKGLIILTSVYSLVMGTILITGQAHILPNI